MLLTADERGELEAVIRKRSGGAAALARWGGACCCGRMASAGATSAAKWHLLRSRFIKSASRKQQWTPFGDPHYAWVERCGCAKHSSLLGGAAQSRRTASQEFRRNARTLRQFVMRCRMAKGRN